MWPRKLQTTCFSKSLNLTKPFSDILQVSWHWLIGVLDHLSWKNWKLLPPGNHGLSRFVALRDCFDKAHDWNCKCATFLVSFMLGIFKWGYECNWKDGLISAHWHFITFLWNYWLEEQTIVLCQSCTIFCQNSCSYHKFFSGVGLCIFRKLYHIWFCPYNYIYDNVVKFVCQHLLLLSLGWIGWNTVPPSSTNLDPEQWTISIHISRVPDHCSKSFAFWTPFILKQFPGQNCWQNTWEPFWGWQTPETGFKYVKHTSINAVAEFNCFRTKT